MKIDPREQLELQICRYLDGELPADECSTFAQRIEQDAAFAAEVRTWRQSDALVQAWGRGVPQLDWEWLAHSIANECARPPNAHVRWHQRIFAPRMLKVYGPPLAAAAAIALVLVGRAILAPAPARAPIAVVKFGAGAVSDREISDHQIADRGTVVRVSFGRSDTPEMPPEPARPVKSMAIVTAGGGASLSSSHLALSWF